MNTAQPDFTRRPFDNPNRQAIDAIDATIASMSNNPYTPPTARTMRVRISFTVDIDPDAWALEYGIDPKDVRADVQNYVQLRTDEYLADNGLTPDQS